MVSTRLKFKDIWLVKQNKLQKMLFSSIFSSLEWSIWLQVLLDSQCMHITNIATQRAGVHELSGPNWTVQPPVSYLSFSEFIEILAADFLASVCGPLVKTMQWVNEWDQMTPYLTLEILLQFPGVCGLYMASAFAGTLSTVSSGINGCSTVVVQGRIHSRFSSKYTFGNLSISPTSWLHWERHWIND